MITFLGEIRAIGFNFAPRGWAECAGQLLPISQNSALFSLLGTMYGGDGRSTFGLPDLRGRVPIGDGGGPGLPRFVQGQRGGSVETTLTIAQMPNHSHSLSAINAKLELEGGDTPVVVTRGGQNSGQTSSSGGSQSFNNMQPFTVVKYIICIGGEGQFPSRP